MSDQPATGGVSAAGSSPVTATPLNLSPPLPAASSKGRAAPLTLSGHMGTVELVATVLAFSAPLAVVSGNIPIVIGFVGGFAPLLFVAATMLLLLLAAGMATMSRYTPNAGAFYTYVTAGLGRVAGLGGAFVAILSYGTMGIATYAYLGSAATRLVTSLGGPTVAWYVYALIGITACAFLGYRNIELSAKVLGVAMLFEIVCVLLFDLAVGVREGVGGLSSAFEGGSALNVGAAGAAGLIAVMSFLGFESTAIYRREVRDPDRTVPRAMYLSVLLIGGFYVLAAFMVTAAFERQGAADDTTGMFEHLLGQYLGSAVSDIASVLLVTSVFAAQLAVQNMLSRYLYSLGRDGVLWSHLGAPHPRHRSPYIASIVVTVVFFLGLLPFLFSTVEPMTLYARIVGIGSYAIFVLMLLAVIAIAVYFLRFPQPDASVWATTIAPVAAAIGLAGIVFMATTRFDLLAGVSGPASYTLIAVPFVVLIAGMALALSYKRRKPDVYNRIGQQ